MTISKNRLIMTKLLTKFPAGTPPAKGYQPMKSVPPDVVPQIVTAIMTVPYQYSQGCIKGLEKYTQQQIREMYQLILHNPPEEFEQPVLPQPPFKPEEDICLLSYINNKSNQTFEQFMSQFGSILNPIRTKDSIEDRISQLESLDKKEIDEIYEECAKQTVNEERLYKSITQTAPPLTKGSVAHPTKEQCRCLPDPIPRFIKNPNLESEINSIEKTSLQLISYLFEKNELALLMNEKVRYSMKNRFIIIGRQSDDESMDNNVDIGFFDTLVCDHVSRVQASIQFMHDGHFYCQNIGQGVFRINGSIIPSMKVARVPDGAIFDFCNIIFLFFINHRLVKRIMSEMD